MVEVSEGNLNSTQLAVVETSLEGTPTVTKCFQGLIREEVTCDSCAKTLSSYVPCSMLRCDTASTDYKQHTHHDVSPVAVGTVVVIKSST